VLELVFEGAEGFRGNTRKELLFRAWFLSESGIGLDLDQMSTIANVERKIRRVEGFNVRILHLRGVDVRGDRTGLPQYPFRHAADSDFTVERWKQTRFRTAFPGFDVDVLDRRRRSMPGNTKLSTVRRSY
jgi:hypothetical protein